MSDPYDNVVTIEHVVNHVLRSGETVTARGLRTVEVINAVVSVPVGLYLRRKGMAEHLGVIEGLGMIGGEYNLDAIRKAAPKADISLFGPQSAYGPRIVRQLPKVVAHLRKDPSSRRAVLTLPKAGEAASPKIPCTVSIQFLIRGGRLNVSVYMRSWDAVFGLPYDLQQFGLLGLVMARVTHTVPGTLTVVAGSLHVYDDTRSLAVNGNPSHGVIHLRYVPDYDAPWAEYVAWARGVVADYLDGDRAIGAYVSYDRPGKEGGA